VHCVHGHEVSQNAARTLRDAGFDVTVLEGGFEAWREAGFDVAPAKENTGGQ
jgi:rhodanese-related sulfurtransferase